MTSIDDFSCRCKLRENFKYYFADFVRKEGNHPHPTRVILIGVFEFICLGHTYKLFHFVHWFQNCFRFRSRTLRSSVGKFFGPLVDLEGEKRQKNAKFQNWLKTHPKLLNA